MTDLYQVIYLSESCLPIEDGAYAHEIGRILSVSRKWNGAHGITGALLFSVGRFAQVLEGPSSILKSTFGFIACDYRHKNLRVVQRSFISHRTFGDWSMAYSDGPEHPDLSLMGITGETEGAEGSAILAMLRCLVAREPAEALV
jgi:hypothetical protein